MAAVLIAYLLLCAPVTVQASAYVCEGRGGASVFAGIAGAGVRRDVRFEGRNMADTLKKLLSGHRQSGAGRGVRRMVVRALRLSRVQRLEVCVLAGAGDAASAAVCAGALRALLCALCAKVLDGNAAHIRVAADSMPGFALEARCIFSFVPGDIMLASLAAARNKHRREGLRWISIPSRA